jgi:hypothetical protein
MRAENQAKKVKAERVSKRVVFDTLPRPRYIKGCNDSSSKVWQIVYATEMPGAYTFLFPNTRVPHNIGTGCTAYPCIEYGFQHIRALGNS